MYQEFTFYNDLYTRLLYYRTSRAYVRYDRSRKILIIRVPGSPETRSPFGDAALTHRSRPAWSRLIKLFPLRSYATRHSSPCQRRSLFNLSTIHPSVKSSVTSNSISSLMHINFPEMEDLEFILRPKPESFHRTHRDLTQSNTTETEGLNP